MEINVTQIMKLNDIVEKGQYASGIDMTGQYVSGKVEKIFEYNGVLWVTLRTLNGKVTIKMI